MSVQPISFFNFDNLIEYILTTTIVFHIRSCIISIRSGTRCKIYDFQTHTLCSVQKLIPMDRVVNREERGARLARARTLT